MTLNLKIQNFLKIIFPLAIQAGILKPPFFNPNLPYAMNYGTAGFVVGHEFTHGFDDDGSHYDESGRLHNWWSAGAAAKFRNLSECYVRQYESMLEPASKMHVSWGWGDALT